MFHIRYNKTLDKWEVLDPDDNVILYSETKEGAIATMEYMNKNGR